MAFGFPVTGNLEDSGVYKPMHPTYAAEEMQDVLDHLKSSNLEWIQKIDNEIRASALKCKQATAEGGDQARLLTDKWRLARGLGARSRSGQ